MIAWETRVFLLSVLTGAGLGPVYDLFSALRLFSGKAAAFLEDGVFFLIAGAVSFSLFQTVSYGQLRLFLLIGEGMGFFLYRLSAGRAVRFFLFGLVRGGGRLLQKLCRRAGTGRRKNLTKRKEKTIQSDENRKKNVAS